MNDGIESVGAVVTGGLIARTIEPHAGEATRSGGVCLNCGTGLTGDYCHRCGQQGHVHRTLTAWWHDLAHGVLHLDGKIWRTLPLLAWRPGELTRRYIEGERARFVSPMALFLFSVFLMFAVFSTLSGPIGTESDVVQFENDVDRELDPLARRLAELEAGRREAVAKGSTTSWYDESIASVRQEIAVLNSIRGDPIEKAGGAFQRATVETPSNWFDNALKQAKENPSLFGYKVQTNAYKFSWALIPISVPFVWLLFLWRRQYRVYDHTVFVTYSLAFMTLLTVALSLARTIGLPSGPVVFALMLIPPIHMYRQLRGAYRLSRFSAWWRSVLLVFFAIVSATLFVLLLVLAGVVG